MSELLQRQENSPRVQRLAEQLQWDQVEATHMPTPSGFPCPYISDLAVTKELQRQGIGTALVRACEELCVQWGFDCAYLKVEASNTAGLQFYEALGYRAHAPEDRRGEVLMRASLMGIKGEDSP
ncbi:unnamed protein product [Discosporangium mesarthrocarpum]